MAFTSKALRLEQKLRAELAQITDTQVRDLVKAWVDAWNEVETDLVSTLVEMLTAGENVTRNQLLRSTRLQKALAVIADNLDALTRMAGVRIVDDLRDIIDAAGGAQASIIDSQLPPRAPQLVDLEAWSRVDARQLEAIVKRSTQQITSLTKPLSTEAYDAVRRELIRGVASGSNPTETARRMVKRAEGGFNGGLSRAINIARTETLDAHRAGSALGQAQHADVLTGWMWLAALTSRTCPACLSMHGTLHELSESGPDGHQQCRCARLPQTKPWSELGFDIPEPPSLVPDADAFFAGLTKDEQVGILGQRGWDAWNAGQFPRSAWAVQKSTDGWRDSWQTAKAPVLKSKDGAIVVPAPKDVPGAWTGTGSPTPGVVTRERAVTVKPHERVTSYRVASLGENVHWLGNPTGRKTPDAVVKKLQWEIKAPQGTTARTVRNNLEQAREQGERAILDLYRTELRNDLDTVRAAIDAYWGDSTSRGTPRVESIWVLTDNVRDHFTLEYKTWLSQR